MIARFYEFRRNKPLYMDARYQLTDDDSTVAGHYSWKQPSRFDAIEAAYRDALSGAGSPAAASAGKLEEDVRKIIRELDADGRWVTTYAGERLIGQPDFHDSFRYISSAVFSRNVEVLSRYIQSAEKP